MFGLVCEPPAEAGDLTWQEMEACEPGPGQVRIRVAVAGVNRADLLQRKGLYPPPPGASALLGLEVSGLVESLGEGVSEPEPGTRVMALLTGGGYAELAVAEASHLMVLPEAVPFTEAGGIPEAYLTAHRNLFDAAHLSPGERVLIQGGSGGVGSAAIQLARAAGAEVWATARTPQRAAWCLEVGAHRAFCYAAGAFWPTLHETGGVDVVLDCVGGAYLGEHLRLLRRDGRLALIGLQGGRGSEVDLAPLLRKNLTITGRTLRDRPATEKADLIARFWRRWGAAICRGELRPRIDSVWPMAQAAAAHRRMEQGLHRGKIVLETPFGEEVV